VAAHETSSHPTRYGHYLPLVIGGQRHLAMIDSGNLWRCVMSEGLAKKLRITIKPIATAKISTAKKGGGPRGPR